MPAGRGFAAAFNRRRHATGAKSIETGLRLSEVGRARRCVGLLLLFEVARRKKSVYLCRLKHSLPGRTPRNGAAPSRWPFAWTRSPKGLSEDEVRHCVGLDAYVALRFLGMCRRLFGGAALVVLVTLLPAFSRGVSGRGSRRKASRMFRGGQSRRRRGCHADSPGRRVAAPPRVPSG